MFFFLDLFGVVVFAMTGCLVAARHRLDIVGFFWLATVTAVGGGTFRDIILGRPVFWLEQPIYLYLCLLTTLLMYVTAHWVHKNMRLLLWCDAIGLAVFSVIGTQIALSVETLPVVALLMGILTATFGGILRDLLAGEPTLIMRREIYVTASLLSAGLYLLAQMAYFSDTLAAGIAISAGFALRALALQYRLTLPGYHLANPSQESPPQPDRRRNM